MAGAFNFENHPHVIKMLTDQWEKDTFSGEIDPISEYSMLEL
jgi:hypothetical protein